MGAKINREGEIKSSKYGGEMLIVTYNTRADILVRFLDHNNIVHTNYHSFTNGNVISPYHKTVYGVGYIGEGEYKSYDNATMKQTTQYKKWCGILRRCYSKNEKDKWPTYKDVIVCDEWLNFQNFALWYDKNFYEVDGETMHLDKDILIKGNREYSPDACVFVPARINLLFVKNNTNRGDLPIGVTYDKETKKYIARCSGGYKMKTEHVSCHDTKEEAFQSYKMHKELVIKDTANEYKDKIPEKLYKAMINYKVEIND